MHDAPDLTERETEILEQLATGASNRQIAQRLHISTNTVKVHLHNIYQKLGVESRTEATLYGLEAGLLETIGSAGREARSGGFLRTWPALVLALVLVVAGGALADIIVRSASRSTSPDLELQKLEDARWADLAPIPTPRRGMATAAYEGLIYVIGGETVEGVTGSVERYDPSSNTWESLSPKPTPVMGVQAVAAGGKIYVPGGRMADGRLSSAVEVYDVQTDEWHGTSSLPMGLADYALTSFEGKIFLFGGESDDGDLASTFILDPGTDSWEKGPNLPKSGMGWMAISTAKGIYLIEAGTASQNSHDVYMLSPKGASPVSGSWTPAVGYPQDVTAFGGSAFLDVVYLMGETNPDGSGLILEYQSDQGTWVQQQVPATDGWDSRGIVGSGAYLYSLGGNEGGEITGRVGRYQAVYTLLIPIAH